MLLQKTDSARVVLAQHCSRLTTQERRVLILCDGHRSLDQIVTVLGVEAMSCIQKLCADGFLTPAESTRGGARSGKRADGLRHEPATSIAPPSTAPSAVQPIASATPSNPLLIAHGETLERLHALIVDDSLAVRHQLQAGLEQMGFVCHTAESAEAAQASIHANRYNLILLDVVMPGMDGYEFCRSIKRDRQLRDIPVVMLTSRTSPFDRARGALAGCDSYLTKPASWNQLVDAVQKVILRWAQSPAAKKRCMIACKTYIIDSLQVQCSQPPASLMKSLQAARNVEEIFAGVLDGLMHLHEVAPTASEKVADRLAELIPEAQLESLRAAWRVIKKAVASASASTDAIIPPPGNVIAFNQHHTA